jgi:hypothetical protein
MESSFSCSTTCDVEKVRDGVLRVAVVFVSTLCGQRTLFIVADGEGNLWLDCLVGCIAGIVGYGGEGVGGCYSQFRGVQRGRGVGIFPAKG